MNQARNADGGQIALKEGLQPSHIPGPWFFSQESIDSEWFIVTIQGGLIVANVNAHHRQIANARLIAAAPDLLNACRKAEEWLSGWASADPYIDVIRAAIAKAVSVTDPRDSTKERALLLSKSPAEGGEM